MDNLLETLFGKKRKSPKRRKASPKRRKASPKRRKASPKRRKASPKRRKGVLSDRQLVKYAKENGINVYKVVGGKKLLVSRATLLKRLRDADLGVGTPKRELAQPFVNPNIPLSIQEQSQPFVNPNTPLSIQEQSQPFVNPNTPLSIQEQTHNSDTDSDTNSDTDSDTDSEDDYTRDKYCKPYMNKPLHLRPLACKLNTPSEYCKYFEGADRIPKECNKQLYKQEKEDTGLSDFLDIFKPTEKKEDDDDDDDVTLEDNSELSSEKNLVDLLEFGKKKYLTSGRFAKAPKKGRTAVSHIYVKGRKRRLYKGSKGKLFYVSKGRKVYIKKEDLAKHQRKKSLKRRKSKRGRKSPKRRKSKRGRKSPKRGRKSPKRRKSKRGRKSPKRY